MEKKPKKKNNVHNEISHNSNRAHANFKSIVRFTLFAQQPNHWWKPPLFIYLISIKLNNSRRFKNSTIRFTKNKNRFRASVFFVKIYNRSRANSDVLRYFRWSIRGFYRQMSAFDALLIISPKHHESKKKVHCT